MKNQVMFIEQCRNKRNKNTTSSHTECYLANFKKWCLPSMQCITFMVNQYKLNLTHSLQLSLYGSRCNSSSSYLLIKISIFMLFMLMNKVRFQFDVHQMFWSIVYFPLSLILGPDSWADGNHN